MTDVTLLPFDRFSETVYATVHDGYGLVCMYASEPGAVPGAIDAVFRRGGDLRVFRTELSSPEYPSLSALSPLVVPYEREMKEMNGLIPTGSKDQGPQRIMWEFVNGHPLQKGPLPAERRQVPIPDNAVSGEGVFEIPVGPVHAGVIEPGHFRISAAGEPILRLTTHLGYTYRGIERLLETPAAQDNTRLVERIAGDCSVANALAYAHVMEEGTEVPRRARLLRVIFAELERIYCHISDIGGMATDTGFCVPAAFGAGLKEKMLRLNELIGGHRFLMGSIVPGGVRRDISDGSLEEIKVRILKVRFDVEELLRMLTGSVFFMDRAETTGVLSNRDALAVRAVGVAARASGVASDVRTDLPYDAYGELGHRLVTREKGDVYARLCVRADEIFESTSLISQCLDKLEAGPLRVKPEIRDGTYVSLVEAPRGELMHAVRIVDGRVWRYKVRDPSFVNWIAFEHAFEGNIVPDFPLINKSFSLSYSGNDL